MLRFREEKGLFQKRYPEFKMSMNSKALQGVPANLRLGGRRDQKDKDMPRGLSADVM
jgi:hypothetical protein